MTGATPDERRARGFDVLRAIMLALDEETVPAPSRVAFGRARRLTGDILDRERLIERAHQYGAGIHATRGEIEEVLRLSIASMFCEPSSVDTTPARPATAGVSAESLAESLAEIARFASVRQ
jgi:hypothetical protein